MTDLSTTYLGLTLRSPLVPSASPLSEDIDNIKRMEDAGAAAVVMHSLFEEQLRHERYGTESFAEALTYFPEPAQIRIGPETYLEHIQKVKQQVSIPIIASLNGSSVGGWTSYAQQIEQAGADALELNIYYIPTDLNLTGTRIEQTYLDIFKSIKGMVRFPIAIKLSPFFTNLANLAKQLDDAGADALVLFNRFYQPDINLKTLEIEPNVLLSTSQSMRLPMRWIAILFGRIRANLAATSGIHRGQDALKMLMAGADVTMLCSVLLRRNIEQIRVIEQEMRDWMEEHEYASVQQMKGSMSQLYCPNPSEFERVQYVRSLQTLQPDSLSPTPYTL
jgi:dihydroorotate dehydrogenase (fumarate)